MADKYDGSNFYKFFLFFIQKWVHSTQRPVRAGSWIKVFLDLTEFIEIIFLINFFIENFMGGLHGFFLPAPKTNQLYSPNVCIKGVTLL